MNVIGKIQKFWSWQSARSGVVYITLGIISASVCILLAKTALFRNFEFLALDMFFRLRADTRVALSKNIVIVEITSDDLQAVGHWPWPRSRMADLVTELKGLGAKGIFLDFLISEPSNSVDDDALAGAVEGAGNVYLPWGYSTAGLNIQNNLFPIEKIRRHAKGIGFANVFTDTDGKVRRVPLFFWDGSRLHKSIILQIAQDHLNMGVKAITPEYLLLANEQKEVSIPLISGNTMLLNWQGHSRKTFVHYSFSDILNASREVKNGGAPQKDVSFLKNSLCIVAITALGLYDTRANSIEAECPGASFLATALENIYSGNFLKVMPQWFNILVIYFFSFVPVFYIFAQRFSRDVFMIVFVFGSLGIMYFLFINNIIINFSLPIIAFAGSYIGVSAYSAVKMSAEKKQLVTLAITDGLSGLYNIRYFQEVLKNACWEAQNDPRQKFYLILADIDFFKQFNDRYGHQAGDYVIEQVAKSIKSLVRSADVVARYGGDEIIVLLRATTDSNARAVAEKICSFIQNLSLKWEGHDLSLTMSLGMAHFDSREDNAATIVKKADNALLLAKKKGRNRVVII